MTPPSHMVVIESEDDPITSIRRAIDVSQWRFSVIGENPDEILGVLLAKNLLPLLFKDSNIVIDDLLSCLLSANCIPESKRLNCLLNALGIKRYPMALVPYEHASMLGLVTIENVLEHIIIGAIKDETERRIIAISFLCPCCRLLKILMNSLKWN